MCLRVPDPNDDRRRDTSVWDVAATTRAILQLADHLVQQRVERVVVESTSDYWRPFFYLLRLTAFGLIIAAVVDKNRS